ncbi:MAG: TetR/AcrR family transcriptional regulator [Bdellovibrionales bacterium]|nr:TetR/AcrR family transcriptional regulator [Bdellovibrionales bacterium]
MIKHTQKKTSADIIIAARKLFAEKGFSATSIREISSSANVNIASVNYHFKTKERLMYEVLKDGYQNLIEKIQTIPPKYQIDVTIFCVQVFRCFVEEKESILNNMKIILSSEYLKMEDFGFSDETLGPPGAEMLLKVFEKSEAMTLTKTDAIWFVQTVFSMLFHKAIMVVSPMAMRPSARKLFSEKTVERHIRRTVDCLVESLRYKYDQQIRSNDFF